MLFMLSTTEKHQINLSKVILHQSHDCRNLQMIQFKGFFNVPAIHKDVHFLSKYQKMGYPEVVHKSFSLRN